MNNSFHEKANDVLKRHPSLNKKLRDCRDPNCAEPWKNQVIIGLYNCVTSEYKYMRINFENYKQCSAIALSARNLLELRIWSEFVHKDSSNTKTIYDDTGRDIIELHKKILKEVEPISPEWAASLAASNQIFRAKAHARGAGSLDEKYTDIRKVVEILKRENMYNIEHKFLSKLAHPTGFSIMAPEKLKDDYCDQIYNIGCSHFVEAFSHIENYMSKYF